MLNRNKKGVDEIGNVHYLLPKSFTTTFDMEDKDGSSHDFGQYQLNPDGTPKEANLKEHAHIFAAGIKVSRLIDKYLTLIARNAGANVIFGNLLTTLMSNGQLYQKFQKEYEVIINEARIASEWQGKVNSIQTSLSNVSGSKQIQLRGELAAIVAQKAKAIGEEYETILKTEQQEYEDEISAISKEILNGANEIRQYLSIFEVQKMITPYEKSRLWDKGQATGNHNQAKQYKGKAKNFGNTLTTIARNIEEHDNLLGSNLFNI